MGGPHAYEVHPHRDGHGFHLIGGTVVTAILSVTVCNIRLRRRKGSILAYTQLPVTLTSFRTRQGQARSVLLLRCREATIRQSV